MVKYEEMKAWQISRDFGKTWHACRKPAKPDPAPSGDDYREEFESWAESSGFSMKLWNDKPGVYENAITSGAYEAYKAGRKGATP